MNLSWLSCLGRAITVITGPMTRQNLMGWILLILAVFTIRWALIEPFYVPSGSMEPTLHGDPRFLRGDRVAVNKLSYGLRIPFTKKRLIKLGEPKRWDVVVFNNVDPNAKHGILIKRVVALPGERVHIADGKIHINGAPVDPPDDLKKVLNYSTSLGLEESEFRNAIFDLVTSGKALIPQPPLEEGITRLNADVACIREKLGSRSLSTLTESERNGLMQALSPLARETAMTVITQHAMPEYRLKYGILPEDEYSVVPPGHYLVCGDNSLNSLDGRYFGWLPEENLVGRAYCIWWPFPRMRDLSGFSHTWWGRLLLFGIPAVLIGYEVLSSVRRRHQKQSH